MKKTFLSLLIIIVSLLISTITHAQNTFPSTGRVGIYTTSPAASLQVKGGARFGTLTNYVNIDSATGNLSFIGTSAYQVGGNKYAFQYTGNPNYGLFFNSSSVQYEFRNGSAIPVFSVNANTGNSVFNGTLKIGAYTLPSTDGTNGQTLTTNGAGVVKWSTISGGGSSQWTTSGSNIYYNTGNVGIGTTTPGTALTVQISASGYGIESTNGTVSIKSFQNTTLGQIGTYSNHPFQLMANNGINQFVLLPNGNVGIGNGTPSLGGLVADTKAGAVNAMFGSNTTGVAIESANPGVGLNTYYNNGRKFISSGYGAVIGLDPASGLLGFYNSATSGAAGASATTPVDLAITAAGNVGIGTIAPGAKLDVNGDAHINGLTVGRGSGNISSNVAAGYNALSSNTTGTFNTATGSQALYLNTTGVGNTAIGGVALYANTTGYSNIAVGGNALASNTSGNDNTANGFDALFSNTTGVYNTASGSYALHSNSTGGYNVANGDEALYSNTTGTYNTANGNEVLYSNTAGRDNTANGYQALYYNTTGGFNTVNGYQALFSNTTGVDNTADGVLALMSNTTGYINIGLGTFSDVSTGALSNADVIGYGAVVDASDKVRVGNSNVTSIGGQVGWTSFSDGRFKKNIKEDVKGLAFINALRPITYNLDLKGINDHYDALMKGRPDSLKQKIRAQMKESETTGSKIVYNGFIAQEVEATAKKLNYNFSGVDKPATEDGLYGLRYSDFVVPLVKAVQELAKMNDAKNASIDSLTTANATQQKINTDLQQQINELKAIVLSGNHSSSNVAETNKQTVELGSVAALSQNVPNPFSNSTTIYYSLPINNGNAYLNFYDANGRTLKSVKLAANSNGSLTLHASELPSGVYRYALLVDGNLIDSKQMILSR